MIALSVLGVAILLKLFFWPGLAGDLVFAMWILTGITLLTLQKTRSPFSFFMGLWLVAAGVSMATTKQPLTTLTSWFILDVYVLLFCLLCQRIKNTKQIALLFGLLCIGAVCSSLVGIKQFIWMSVFKGPILDHTQNLIFQSGRAPSLQGWPTAFAGHLILFIPCALLFFKNKPTLTRGTYSALLILGLMSSGSVLPTFCLILAMILCIRINDLKWGLLSLVFILIYTLGTKEVESFLTARQEYYKAAYDMILAHPFIGGGFGSFVSTGISKSAFVHNSYFQVWAETGIAGLVAICGIFWTFFNLKPHNKSIFETGLYVGLLAVFIDNFFSFTILKSNLALVWWVGLAIYSRVWEQEENTKLKVDSTLHL